MRTESNRARRNLWFLPCWYRLGFAQATGRQMPGRRQPPDLYLYLNLNLNQHINLCLTFSDCLPYLVRTLSGHHPDSQIRNPCPSCTYANEREVVETFRCQPSIPTSCPARHFRQAKVQRARVPVTILLPYLQ